jgi:hypothetical protein
MVEPMTDFQIILCTCADHEQAERIARQLVELRLAACVNYFPGCSRFTDGRARSNRLPNALS